MSGTSDAPPCGISETSASPNFYGLWSPRIDNIRKSTSPNFIKSDELKASVDKNFSIDPIALPIITQVFSDKLSDSSSRDLYTRCRLNLATESVNPLEIQFENHGISVVYTLNRSSGICSPSTRIRKSPDVTHFRSADLDVGKGEAVGDAVGDKSDYSKENYETDF